jgi:ribose 5-phosphate isomerase RpiB
MAQELVSAYLHATFSNEERQVRRLNKVKALEQRCGTEGT